MFLLLKLLIFLGCGLLIAFGAISIGSGLTAFIINGETVFLFRSAIAMVLILVISAVAWFGVLFLERSFGEGDE